MENVHDDATDDVSAVMRVIACVELALVTHKPRAASAYAVGASRCAGEFRCHLSMALCRRVGNRRL